MDDAKLWSLRLEYLGYKVRTLLEQNNLREILFLLVWNV